MQQFSPRVSRFSLFLAVFIPALLGVGVVAVTVLWVRNPVYGWSLFCLWPVVQSLLAAFLYSYKKQPIAYSKCYGVGMLSFVVGAAMILLFSLDGLLCLAMAFPLVALLNGLGSWMGWRLGQNQASKTARLTPLVIAATFPCFLAFEHVNPPQAPLHEVTTRVLINAPIQQVWDEVIAFDRIDKPPSLLFRMGIAYPIEARIEGEGVGATRYCIFSTGPFIEPITHWEAPHLLAFSVSFNPPVLTELSPWGHLETDHLHGTFTSERGQFRLYEENGQTVLEGTTWYRQAIHPDFYWSRISNYLIHKIHLRVLHHIRSSVTVTS